MKHNNISLAQSFLCAVKGIGVAALERNFKIELAVMLLAVVLGFVCQISVVEWLVVVVCSGLVLALEAANTAIEAVVDLASPEIHPLARRAKDTAAGAVLITSTTALTAAVIIFAPKLIALIGG